MRTTKLNRFLSLLLVLVMIMTLLPTAAFADAGTVSATLITDASTLTVGDKVIIAAKDSDFALSTNQKSNNRGQAAVEKKWQFAYVRR